MSQGWLQNWAGFYGDNSFAPFQGWNHYSLVVEAVSQLSICCFFFFNISLW
jgi:hypothetical protein